MSPAPQHDEWTEMRRYGLEVLAKSRLRLVENPDPDTDTRKEVTLPAITA